MQMHDHTKVVLSKPFMKITTSVKNEAAVILGSQDLTVARAHLQHIVQFGDGDTKPPC